MTTRVGIVLLTVAFGQVACGDDDKASNDTKVTAKKDAGGSAEAEPEPSSAAEPASAEPESEPEPTSGEPEVAEVEDAGKAPVDASEPPAMDASPEIEDSGAELGQLDADVGDAGGVDGCGTPQLLGTFEPPSGQAEGFSVDGERAVLASTSAGIYVVDLSDPSQPGNLGQYDFPSGQLAYRVAAQGDLVAVGLRGNGWALLDASDLESISMFSSDNTASAEDVALSGDTLFFADGNGVSSVDVSDPGDPLALTTDLILPGSSKALLVDGNWVYVASLGAGVSVVDATDPAALSEHASVDVGSSGSTHIALNGGTLYAAHSEGVTMLDVTDPADPMAIGEYVRERAHALAVSGQHLFVFGDDTATKDVPFLAVLDVTDPAAPAELNTDLALFDSPVYAAIAGEWLLATVEDDNALHVFEACPQP